MLIYMHRAFCDKLSSKITLFKIFYNVKCSLKCSRTNLRLFCSKSYFFFRRIYIYWAPFDVTYSESLHSRFSYKKSLFCMKRYRTRIIDKQVCKSGIGWHVFSSILFLQSSVDSTVLVYKYFFKVLAVSSSEHDLKILLSINLFRRPINLCQRMYLPTKCYCWLLSPTYLYQNA